jgi:hypothetical protein
MALSLIGRVLTAREVRASRNTQGWQPRELFAVALVKHPLNWSPSIEAESMGSIGCAAMLLWR